MGLLEIILLGIIQGITEFLPISSDGHLVVASTLMRALGVPELSGLLEVEIILHLGTLLSILVFYRQRIARLLGEDRRIVPLLVIATLPAVVFVLALKGMGISLEFLENPLLAGVMFLVTAALLVWGSRNSTGELEYTRLSWQQALLIGLFQATAILPGLSRSGTTIVAGRLVGLRWESATTFSFLLAIPAICGAGVLQGMTILKEGGTATPPGNLLVGAVVAFAVGLVALNWLTWVVRHGRLVYFAYWLVPLGIAVIIWQLTSPTTPSLFAH